MLQGMRKYTKSECVTGHTIQLFEKAQLFRAGGMESSLGVPTELPLTLLF